MEVSRTDGRSKTPTKYEDGLYLTVEPSLLRIPAVIHLRSGFAGFADSLQSGSLTFETLCRLRTGSQIYPGSVSRKIDVLHFAGIRCSESRSRGVCYHNPGRSVGF